jgi:outer membrane receptor for ferrienterochelin and colicins
MRFKLGAGFSAVSASLAMLTPVALAQPVPQAPPAEHDQPLAQPKQPPAEQDAAPAEPDLSPAEPDQPPAPPEAPPTQAEPLPESQAPGQPDSSEPSPQSFTGAVLDCTGAPVRGARVTIAELGMELFTSESGEVELQLPPGTYEVTVEAEGFAPLTEIVLFDDSTAMTGFELLLEYKLEEVTVTGTSTEKAADAAPVRTQVVSRERIERRKATNLAESLDAMTGVRVENNCQNCSFTQVRLNGLGGQYTQLLIDGRPVMSTLANVYGLEQIPEEMIGRIEIVKGGGSALYGGNAVGGVINVITTRPRSSFGTLTLRSGLVGLDAWETRLASSAGAVSGSGRFALHVFGGATAREPWDKDGDGFSELGRIRQIAAGAESYWDVVANGELQLKFHSLREHRRGGNRFNQPEHNAAIAESIHSTRYGGELRFKYLVDEHVSYDLGYGVAYTERQSYYGGGGDAGLPALPADVSELDQAEYDGFLDAMAARQAALGAYGRTKNPVHTADMLLNIAFEAAGEMILTVGGQFWTESLEDQFPGYRRVIHDTYSDLGLIAQHDWLFADWGESVVGVRIDRHTELDDPVVSPRASLMLDPLDWLRLRTACSTGFRAPQVFDEDLHITMVGGEGQVIRNVPALGPERSYSLAQQVEGDFELGENWDLDVGLNGFLTAITDAFVVEQHDDPSTPGELEFERRNRGTTTVVGAEAEARLSFRAQWGAGAGATVERARNDQPDEDFGSRDVFRTPQAYGYAETWLCPLSALTLSTDLQITGPMKVPHYAGYIPEDRLEQSATFYDWGANVAYRVDIEEATYVQPFVGMRNLLDSYQDDLDRGPSRDAGYIYGPRMPRTVYAGLKGGI